MDMPREIAPLLIGTLLPPLVMLVMRASWSGLKKFGVSLVPALLVGFCASLLSGELAGSIPDGFIAIIVDTSLVFMGSQLAYRLFWKRALEEHLVQRDPQPAPERVRR
jgi:hypothetical protein